MMIDVAQEIKKLELVFFEEEQSDSDKISQQIEEDADEYQQLLRKKNEELSYMK